MKMIALVLSMVVTASGWAQAPAPPAGGSEEEPIVIIGSRPKPGSSPQEREALKATRGVGIATIGAGFGLLGLGVATLAAWPIGIAAGLLYAGGLSTYLAQRRLNGKQDFPPSAPTPGR